MINDNTSNKSCRDNNSDANKDNEINYQKKNN